MQRKPVRNSILLKISLLRVGLQDSYSQEKSRKTVFLGQSGKTRQVQEVLLKLEKCQEKVRNFLSFMQMNSFVPNG